MANVVEKFGLRPYRSINGASWNNAQNRYIKYTNQKHPDRKQLENMPHIVDFFNISIPKPAEIQRLAAVLP